MVIVFAVCFCCAFLSQAVLYRTESKNIQVTGTMLLNTENVTRFSYKGAITLHFWQMPYQMAGLGEWIGYIQQLAAMGRTEKYCRRKC